MVRLVVPLTIALVVTVVLAAIAGANPVEVVLQIATGPFRTVSNMLEILARATPLILTGLSVVIAFKSGFWNIGMEGQLGAGALAAAWAGVAFFSFPSPILIPLILLLGFLAGSSWAALAAALKIRFKVDEVITTLLLNWVMVFIIGAVLTGPWRDPVSMWPQSPEISANASYRILLPRSRVHFGLGIALGVVVITYWLMTKTTIGFELRMVGANPEAASYAGVNVNQTLLLAAMLSGGVAGLAGVGEILGVHHHLMEDASGGLGYTGIVVGTLGGLNPWGAVLAAVFLGMIETGGRIASRVTGIPTHLVGVIESVLLIAALAMLFRTSRLRRE